MALQLKEKTDVKIFILYLLMNIGKPIDIITLNDIIMEDEFVNQFDFMDCLCELIDAGAVDKIHFGRSELYNITHEGIIAARTLQSTLLPQIREKSFPLFLKHPFNLLLLLLHQYVILLLISSSRKIFSLF